ncbi:MAG: hypothetical protein OES20_16315 [Gammaproteobacteria bacterium]|nr:hypothetical protein [Gammaproteobacteria bacterium]MDH3857526.1 hypothetical protein [Gammaproteobacteria bacterium]
MNQQTSPLRLLAKTYANDLISREQYVEIRAQLLKRLENRGKIDESDLKNFTALQGSDSPKIQKSYTSSDWIIIALGIAASIALGYVLYA